MLLEYSPQTFEKYSNIKCHENPFGGSRDTTKLMIAVHNFGKAAKNCWTIRIASTEPKQARKIIKKAQIENSKYLRSHNFGHNYSLFSQKSTGIFGDPTVCVFWAGGSRFFCKAGKCLRDQGSHILKNCTLHSHCHENLKMFRESSLLNNLPSWAWNVPVTSAKEV
jgi:hypothetical protein